MVVVADVQFQTGTEVGWAITWGCFIVLHVGGILAGGTVVGRVRFSLILLF